MEDEADRNNSKYTRYERRHEHRSRSRRSDSLDDDRPRWRLPLWCRRCFRKKKKAGKKLRERKRRFFDCCRRRMRSDDERSIASDAPSSLLDESHVRLDEARARIDESHARADVIRARADESRARVDEIEVERSKDRRASREKRKREMRDEIDRIRRRSKERRRSMDVEIPRKDSAEIYERKLTMDSLEQEYRDFAKTCCYLCAQKVIGFSANIVSKMVVSEKGVQLSNHQWYKVVPTLDKGCSSPNELKKRKSSKSRTREVATMHPDSMDRHKEARSKPKRKKRSILPKITIFKYPNERAATCTTRSKPPAEKARKEPCCRDRGV